MRTFSPQVPKWLRFAAGLLCTILTNGSITAAPTPPEPYEIGTWRGFRDSAVSYTFDDNSPKQFSVAQPMFDERGLSATFFCIVGNLSDVRWAEIENASAKGHEIGSHTLTHPDLTQLSYEQMETEESDSKDLIESHTGKKCVSLAYPYCTVPDESITLMYYPFARSCNGALVPTTPKDFLSIGAMGPDIGLNEGCDQVADAGSWLVWLLHGIDDDPACCPTDSTVLQANLDYVMADPGKWWVETFGNVSRYIQERDASTLTVLSEATKSISLRLSHDLDDTVFNYPLSLRRPMPSDWASASVTQNGVPVPSQVVDGKLMFDVVPNGGDIVLSKESEKPYLTINEQGRIVLSFKGTPPANGNLEFEQSSDLKNWTPLPMTKIGSGATMQFITTDATQNASRIFIRYYTAP